MLAFARRTLLWKYAAYFAGLVSLLLAISGIVSGYFAYRESIAALEEVQQATARYAAIENFMLDVQRAMQASLEKFDDNGAVVGDDDDLRLEFVALLRYHPEVSVLRWIGGDGDERVVLSRFGLERRRTRPELGPRSALSGCTRHHRSCEQGPVSQRDRALRFCRGRSWPGQQRGRGRSQPEVHLGPGRPSAAQAGRRRLRRRQRRPAHIASRSRLGAGEHEPGRAQSRAQRARATCGATRTHRRGAGHPGAACRVYRRPHPEPWLDSFRGAVR